VTARTTEVLTAEMTDQMKTHSDKLRLVVMKTKFGDSFNDMWQSEKMAR